MILRHERAEARAREEAVAQRNLVSEDPELGAVCERYREQFQAAVEAALATLDDRAKRVFRMYFVDGLPALQIAKAYDVHHESVRRWVSAAREHVVEEAKRQLRRDLPLSSGEFDSIARLLLSQLDLNISIVLTNQGR
jgi:RNA polymerase sigma-70 factor